MPAKKHVQKYKKTVPYVGIIQIRFMGLSDTAYSQPVYTSSPFA